MKIISAAFVTRLFTGMLVLSLAHSGIGQAAPGDKVQELLQEVKSQAMDRQRAAKQREVERLKEDLEKGRNEAQEAQRSVDAMHAAINEAVDHLGKLNSQKNQLTKTLEVVSLQVDAESLKVEGLKLLSDAQVKGALALAKRADQTEIQQTIEQAKINLAASTGDVDTPEKDRAEREFERKLAKSERVASTAKSVARDAMTAATAKLQEATKADLKAKQRATELGVTGQFLPTPAMETVEPLKDIDPGKPDSAPGPTPEAQ